MKTVYMFKLNDVTLSMHESEQEALKALKAFITSQSFKATFQILFKKVWKATKSESTKLVVVRYKCVLVLQGSTGKIYAREFKVETVEVK